MSIELERTDKETLAVLGKIENETDPRNALVALRARIRHFERAGESVPSALVRAEQHILLELAAQSQGR